MAIRFTSVTFISLIKNPFLLPTTNIHLYFSICKRCIIKMDHHCPWVNNCVGIGNHKVSLWIIAVVIFYFLIHACHWHHLISLYFLPIPTNCTTFEMNYSTSSYSSFTPPYPAHTPFSSSCTVSSTASVSHPPTCTITISCPLRAASTTPQTCYRSWDLRSRRYSLVYSLCVWWWTSGTWWWRI